tara:strand:- start:443 stop:1621 length:1179 start_codon:yes stop_codon:yes gene_type:complete
MAITDKEQGVWELDEVYNKINQGGIWSYDDALGLYGWGRGHYGALGQNNTTLYSSPVQIGVGANWSKVAPSYVGMFGIKGDGTLWSWGQNWTGLLGQNKAPTGFGNYTNTLSSPTQVGTDTDWSTIHSGNATQAFGIKTNGTMWTWGDGFLGATGLNSQAAYSSPTQVPGTNWKQVTGGNNKLAVKTDGTLWAWGENNAGSMGVNYLGQRSSPTQVGTDTTWDQVAQFAANGSLALKTNGTLWMWGTNTGDISGSPGSGNSSPVQVGTNTNWKSVYGTTYSIAAFKTDGTFWTWGQNETGELGHNNRTDYTSPRQIPGTTWTGDSWSGNNYTAATKTDGTMWAWGQNTDYGTLGLNDRTNRSSPTQISGTDWSLDGTINYTWAQGPMAAFKI